MLFVLQCKNMEEKLKLGKRKEKFVDIELFERMINNAQNILVTAHSFPDADAVCSAQIMKAILKKQFGKDCEIVMDGEIGRLLKPFCKDVEDVANLKDCYDLIICLDCASVERTGKIVEVFEKCKQTINIDHHATNEKFAKLNYVDEESSSTCEMLYSLCLERYCSIINPQMARLAYAGIITDTNGLMANNIQSKTYQVIADIVSQGLNVDIIKNYFFKSYSKAKLQLFGKALNSINFYANNKIAVISISKADMDECEANFDDSLGMVDYALNCYLVDIAVAIIEQESGKFYISLRSKHTNVADIAQVFGGGGHSNVAAFQYEGNLSDVFDKLINAGALKLSEKV